MISEFVKWIKANVAILEEGVFGSSWQYKLPEDKKQQMYDFYMMEFLLPRTKVGLYATPLEFGPSSPEEESEAEDKYLAGKGPPMSHVPPHALPKSPNPGGKPGDMGRTNTDKFEYALYEALGKILPNLKKELLEVVNFSLAAELRHTFDNPNSYNMDLKTGNNTPVKKFIEKINKALGPEYGSLLKKYVLNMVNANDPNVLDYIDRSPISGNFKTSDLKYKLSYRAMKNAGGTDEQWATLCKWLFSNAKWNGSYGGKAWADIAEGWLDLYHAEAAHDIITYIDHIYDLEHNTGSVFTKVTSYKKEGGYEWVKEALDHKRYLVSPHEMIEHVSPSMRELAMMGIKLRTGKSWGDFEKEWPEILKHKTMIYNQTKLYQWEKEKEESEKKNGPGYFYDPKPKSLTPEEFAAQLKPSVSLYSLQSVHTNSLKKPDEKGATKEVPSADKIKVGDEVSMEWPPKKWYAVIAVNLADKNAAEHPFWGKKEDTLVLKDQGMQRMVNIHGYRPKSAIPSKGYAPSPAASPMAEPSYTPIVNIHGYKPKSAIPPKGYAPSVASPMAAPSYAPKPVAQPGVFKDAHGKTIAVGDLVKKHITSAPKQGTVTKLNSDGTVSVQYPDYNYEKVYIAAELLILAKGSSAATSGPVKDAHGSDLKVGDKVYAVLGSGMAGVKGQITDITGTDIVVQKPTGSTFTGHAKDFAKETNPAAPAAPKPGPIVVKDAYGKAIKVGDKVQDAVSMKNGFVTGLSGENGGVVALRWQGEYVIKSIEGYKVKIVGGSSSVYKDVHDYTISIGDKVENYAAPYAKGQVMALLPDGDITVMFDGGQYKNVHPSSVIVVTPVKHAPLPVAPKPTLAPAPAPVAPKPTPKSLVQSVTDAKEKRIKDLWATIPKMPKSLKIARVVRDFTGSESFDNALVTVLKVLNINLSSDDKHEVKTAFNEDENAIHYYKQRGSSMSFPNKLTSDEAWNLLQVKFPDPPHVYIGDEGDNKINQMITEGEENGNIKAIKFFREITNFGLAAAKGFIILRRLELYTEGKIKD